jgi:ABC-type uncharacterized transport system substrate-binding protein
MKIVSLLLAVTVLAAPAAAHPHEWVDWGVGLVLDEKKPLKALSAQLELTWDEWYSALVLTDFPGLPKNTLSAADLSQLDTTYGLASPNRAVSLTVTFRGKPVKITPVIQSPRTNGKTVTFVYSLGLGLNVTSPSELRVELYDPTYYTDMGIRSKEGAFFRGVKDPAAYAGSFTFEQDFGHPYYGGSVFPEVVVFALRP